jgi:hypothetical protein
LNYLTKPDTWHFYWTADGWVLIFAATCPISNQLLDSTAHVNSKAAPLLVKRDPQGGYNTDNLLVVSRWAWSNKSQAYCRYKVDQAAATLWEYADTPPFKNITPCVTCGEPLHITFKGGRKYCTGCLTEAYLKIYRKSKARRRKHNGTIKTEDPKAKNPR